MTDKPLNKIKPEQALKFNPAPSPEKEYAETNPEELSANPEERSVKRNLNKIRKKAKISQKNGTAKKTKTILKTAKKIKWAIGLISVLISLAPSCLILGIALIIILVIIAIPSILSDEVKRLLAPIINLFS